MDDLNSLIADYELELMKSGYELSKETFGVWPEIPYFPKTEHYPASEPVEFDLEKVREVLGVPFKDILDCFGPPKESIKELVNERPKRVIKLKLSEDDKHLMVGLDSHKKSHKKRPKETDPVNDRDWRSWYNSEVTIHGNIMKYYGMMFESNWSDWVYTEKEIIEIWKAYGGKPREVIVEKSGFVRMSINGPKKVLSVEEIDLVRTNKTVDTCTLTIMKNQMEMGSLICRRYVAYQDTNNSHTRAYCIHHIKRVA